MADPYASFADSPQTFGRAGAVITPGSTDLDPLPAGYIIPYRVRRVTAATATVASIL